MSALDELLGELSSEGEELSRGHFTLDREKAREKMRKFQLADPLRYVLELVQSAVARGAGRIRFDIDADDMIMRFDGEPFDLEDFEQIYGALFADFEGAAMRARRQLALGLNAAMALEPERILVESGTSEASKRLLIRSGHEDMIEDGELEGTGTVIHVRQRLKPAVMSRFFLNLTGRLPEEIMIRERCQHARLLIDLEDVIVSRGPLLPGAIAPIAIQTGAFSGVIAFNPEVRYEPAFVRLIKDGVWIDTHEIKRAFTGLVAVVECETLRKDVSQSSIVEDDVHDRIMQTLLDAQWRVLVELLRLQNEGPPLFAVGWIQDRIRDWIYQVAPSKMIRSSGGSRLRIPEFASLRAVPLMETIQGDPVDLETLLERQDSAGQIDYSSVRCQHSVERHPLIIFAEKNNSTHRLLSRLFKNVVDRKEAVDQTIVREHNRAAWRQRPTPPRFQNPDAYEVVRDLEVEGFVGQIGISRFKHPRSKVMVIVDGCLFEEMTDVWPLRGLEAVIEGPFRPDALFATLRRDVTLATAMLDILDASIGLFEQLSESPSATRRWPLSCLHGFIDASLHQGMEKQLEGFQKAKIERAAWARRREPWAERARLWPDEAGEGGHGVRRVPFIQTASGERTHLEAIRDEIEAHTTALIIPRELGSIGETERMILCPEPYQHLLEQLFGEEAFEDFSQEYIRLQRADAHAQKPEQAIALSGELLAQVKFEHGGVVGVMGVSLAAMSPAEETENDDKNLTADWSSEVTLLKGHRPISLRFFQCLPGLVVVADHEALTPTEDWNDVEDDAALAEIFEAIAATLPALVTEVLDELEHNPEPATRWLHCAARLPFFGHPFRQVLDGWRRTHNGVSDFRALLGFCQAVTVSAVTQWLQGQLLDGNTSFRLKRLKRRVLESRGEREPLVGSTVRSHAGEVVDIEVPDFYLAPMLALLPTIGELGSTIAGVAHEGLAATPLMRTLTGEKIGLHALAEAAKNNDKIGVVSRRAEIDSPTDRCVLWPDPMQRETLECAIGAARIEDNDDWMQQQEDRARFEQKRPEETLSLDHEDLLAQVEVSLRASSGWIVSGVLGLSEQALVEAIRTHDHRTSVQILKTHRTLCTVTFQMLGGLVAVVNHDEVEPGPRWASVVEGRAMMEVRDAIASTLPALIDAIRALVAAPDTDASTRWALERFLLMAVSALFPSPTLRQLYEEWVDGRGQKKHGRWYRDLLGLVACTELTSVVEAVKVLRHRGNEAPDVAEITRVVFEGELRDHWQGKNRRDKNGLVYQVCPPLSATAHLKVLFPGRGLDFQRAVLKARKTLHPIALFETFRGRRVTLGEAIKAVKKTGSIHHVSRRSEVAEPDFLVLHCPEPHGLAFSLFGSKALVDANAWLEQTEARERFDDQVPVESIELEASSSLLASERVVKGGVDGVLALRLDRIERSFDGATSSDDFELQVYREHKPLGSFTLRALPGLVAAANHDDLVPTQDWRRAQECVAMGELRDALAGSLPGVIDAAAARFNAGEGGRYREALRIFLLRAATLIFPTVSFRRLHDRWVSARGEKYADGEYRALIDLWHATSLEAVDGVVTTLLGFPNAALTVGRIWTDLTNEGLREDWPGQSAKGLTLMPRPPKGGTRHLTALYPVEVNDEERGEHEARALHPLPSLRAVAFFETFSGRAVTLGEVIHDFVARGRLEVVPRRSHAPEPEGRLVLHARPGDVEWLIRLVGEARIEDASEWLRAEEDRLAFEAQQTTDRIGLTRSSDLIAAQTLEADGLEGEVGLTWSGLSQSVGARAWRATLTLFKARRPLGEREVELIGGLSAVVNHDQLVPNANWSGVVESPALHETREAIAAKLPALIDDVVARVEGQPRGDGREVEFLGQVAAAVFPTLRFRAIHALWTAATPASGETMYRDLLELAFACSPAVVDAVLDDAGIDWAPGRLEARENTLSLAQISGRCEDRVDQGPFERGGGSLAHLDVLAPGDGTWTDRARAPLASLRRVAMFESYTGRAVTLGEVLESHEEEKQVSFVRRKSALVESSERLVLFLTHREMGLLYRILGDVFIDATGWLEQEEARERFNAFPLERVRLEVDQSDVLAKVELAGSELQGEMALTLSGWMEARERGSRDAHVWIYRTERRLGWVEFPLLGGLRVAVNHNDIEPNAAWNGVVECGALTHIREAIGRALPALVTQLAEGFESLTGQRRSIARAFLLEVIGMMFPRLAFRQAFARWAKARSAAGARRSYMALLGLATRAALATIEKALLAANEKALFPAPEQLSRFDPRLEGVTTRPVPGSLAWIGALGDPSSGFDKWTEGLPVALRRLALFPCLNRSPVSLEALEASLEKPGGVIEYTFEGARFEDADIGDRLVIEPANEDALELLRRVFSSAALQNATGWLQRQRDAAAFESRPVYETFRLPKGNALVEVAFKTSAFEGVVGLSMDHPGETTSEMKVTLCTSRRQVDTVREDSPQPLIAIINDDNITLSADFQSILKGAKNPRRSKLILAQRPALAAKLLDAFDGLSRRERDAAWHHALDLLLWQHAHGRGDLDGAPWRGLAELEQLQTTAGHRVSLRALRAYIEAHGQVDFVTDPHARGEAVEDGHIVLAVSSFQRSRLEKLLSGKLNNHDRQWEWERRFVRWRASARRQPAPDAAEMLVEIESDARIIEGQLYVPVMSIPQHRPKHIPLAQTSLCFAGSVIETLELTPYFPCAGAVQVGRASLTKNFTEAVISKTQRKHLEERTVVLYLSLCQRFEDDDFGGDVTLREAARDALRYAAVKMAERLRVKGSLGVPGPWSELRERVEVLPLLKLSNGRYISVELAQREQPPELERLGLWDATTRRPIAIKRSPASTNTTKVKKSSGRELKRKEVVEEAKPEKTAPARVAAETPPPTLSKPRVKPPTPEALLLEAVIEELKLVRERNRQLLSDVNLDRLQFGDGSKRMAVICDSRENTINRGHPMIQAALAGFQADAFWVSFVTSAVYTAYNVWLTEITDDDEARFHGVLVEQILTGF